MGQQAPPPNPEPIQPLAAPSAQAAAGPKLAAPPLPAEQAPVTTEAQAAPPPGVPGPAAWQLPHWDKGFVLVSVARRRPMPFRLGSTTSRSSSTRTAWRRTTRTRTTTASCTRCSSATTSSWRATSSISPDTPSTSGSTSTSWSSRRRRRWWRRRPATRASSFTKGFALRAGYFSLPSTRAMTGTYPFFQGTDRSLATNYFRPGFTQGIWAEGEPLTASTTSRCSETR